MVTHIAMPTAHAVPPMKHAMAAAKPAKIMALVMRAYPLTPAPLAIVTNAPTPALVTEILIIRYGFRLTTNVQNAHPNQPMPVPFPVMVRLSILPMAA